MGIKHLFNRHATEYNGLRRKFIPCFDDFYDTVVRVLEYSLDSEDASVLDLGAGTGLLSSFVAGNFPDARILMVDMADRMLAEAKKRFGESSNVDFLKADYLEDDIVGSYDAVVSALSIHHLEGGDKINLFKKVFGLLKPGGVFVNADQVESGDAAVENVYRNIWIRQITDAGITKEQLTDARKRMKEDRMSSLEDQLSWLRKTGYRDVNCWYKNFSFVVYSGTRPL